MSDTQADLTQRARALLFASPGYPGCVSERIVERVAAFAQSEREAERAEARRAAGRWHGHRYSEFQDQLLHKDMNKVTRARIEGQMLAHNESAKHFGAIASPAPQDSRDAQ
jgi:hypothetical protein